MADVSDGWPWPHAGTGSPLPALRPEQIQYAVDRYTKEAHRLYGVLDKALAKTGYLAAGQYTIADMACWPWTASHKNQGVDLDQYPNVLKWFNKINERKAVQKGLALFADLRKPLTDDKAKALLFGLTSKTNKS